MSLIQTLHERLTQEHELTFIEFMQLALYDPQQGYYSAALPKLGKDGDFITAPELSPIFGQTIANQCQQILATLESPVLFEFGAGTGSLCVAILTRLETLGCLPDSYFILELSADLKQRQQKLIKEKIPHLAARVTWLNRWPEAPFNGVILANEVLDAMPVHRVLQTEQGVLESYITLDIQNQLKEIFKPCQNEKVLLYVKRLALTPPYCSEVNLFLNDWLLSNFHMLNKGAVFLIDYGFPRHEYYHADRMQGTIMCHYQHHTHPDFLSHVGEQDITAHVDFTHVAEAASDAGFHIAGFTNQASFLLANGLLSLIEDMTDEQEIVNAKQAVKILIQPSEMGELFKVIALTKHLDISLQGFQLNDKRVSL